MLDWPGRVRANRARQTRLAALDVYIERNRADPVEVRASTIERLRHSLMVAGFDADSVVSALAEACLAAERALGLTPHAGQRQTALALLCGYFAEMQTGEGKTLATALAAAVSALDGTPVHVLTANDYLAERDAQWLSSFYSALGLTSACVLPTMDESTRRTAYARDIVHLTGKQAGFDWMRDALAAGSSAATMCARLGELTASHGVERDQPLPIQRGLCCAIVDEADSLLIDESRTPLVLSSPRASPAELEREGITALALAKMLKPDRDFRLSRAKREVVITDAGNRALAEHGLRVTGIWRSGRYRDERVRQALAAQHLWQRDQHYVLRDDKVILIDEQSGRLLPDRRLQHGLHGLLELKENCSLTAENDTVASIGFQRFFARYRRLVGTSGTLREVEGELVRLYGGSLLTIQPERPSQRCEWQPRLFATRAQQLDALMSDLRTCQSHGRPVLVGTRSVAQSSGVSALLQAHGMEHRVLNARHLEEEASIVAEAGGKARVTVATNMAGRGTDIPLAPGVAERGGLHVVSLAFNDARRIDRQLSGRAARQGDPGSCRRLWSLDDAALHDALPTPLRAIARHLLGLRRFERAGEVLALQFVYLAQRRIEWRHARERHQAMAALEHIDHHVAIGGHSDHPA